MSNAITVETLQEAIEVTKEVIEQRLKLNDFYSVAVSLVVWFQLKKQEALKNENKKTEEMESLLQSCNYFVKPLLADSPLKPKISNIEIETNDNEDDKPFNILRSLKKAHELIKEYAFKQENDKAIEVAGVAYNLKLRSYSLLVEEMQKIDTLYQEEFGE